MAPVPLGNLTYIPRPGRAEFRPSPVFSMGVLLLCGGFGFVTGLMTLCVVGAALNTLFGWEILGMKAEGEPPAPFWGLGILAIGLLPGTFAAAMGAMLVHLVRFWCHPTVIDYEKGTFRLGGQEVCRLSDIREVRLRRITDPNYPGKAKAGLAVVLRDGSMERLEPRSSFLDRFGDRKVDPFTDLGPLRDGPQMEAVRRAASEVAARTGVPLNERHERGNLAPTRGMGG